MKLSAFYKRFIEPLIFVAVNIFYVNLQAGVQTYPEYQHTIQLPSAHKISRGSAAIPIALLGPGFDVEHAELSGRAQQDPVTGLYGINLADGTDDVTDTKFHYRVGSVQAITLAGANAGVAPETLITNVKIFAANGSTTYEKVLLGIDYAIRNGAKILLMAFGGHGGGYNSAVCQRLRALVEKHDVLIVASASNNGGELNQPTFPGECQLPTTMTVATTDEKGKLTRFSGYSKQYVDIAVPGVNMPNPFEENASGGSYSAAVLAAAANIVWSAHPELNANEVKQKLLSSVTTTDELKDKVASGGILNVAGALQ